MAGVLLPEFGSSPLRDIVGFVRNWEPRVGFEGSLHELFELMAVFYPGVPAIATVQRWLLVRAASQDETFICRMHAGVPRGTWVPRDGANSYLASDNEFATSVFGLTWSGDAERLTSGSLLDVLAIRGVTLCWELGTTPEQKTAVLRSHAEAGIALRLPTGGTSLYRPRAEQRLKLAHLTPAAKAIETLCVTEPVRRRLRMFRSVNPLNMYPLPQAGKRFEHAAEWRGAPLVLEKNDLGETDEVLACLVALLEEKYRVEGHASDFAAYAKAAQFDLTSLDLPALRTKSREVHVTITPRRNGRSDWRTGAPADSVLSYEEFKAWAREKVQRYGYGPRDLFASGESKETEKAKGAPLVHARFDGFAEDNDEYNTIFRVARDTTVSSLAYFLLLDERHHGDCNAIFRPDMSRTHASLKPLLAFTESDIRDCVVPHLCLYRGEVKGWNVLSKGRVC